MSEAPAHTSPDAELQARLLAQRSRQGSRTVTIGADDAGPAKARRSRARDAQRWMRFLHVYASMIAFLIILFFGVTGLLLNHPTWIYGDEVVTTELAGTLPDSVIAEDGRIEFLSVSEYLRSEVGVVGEVTNFDQVGDQGSINYTGPSYGASVRFDVSSLEYTVSVREEGFVNAMRDLHSGTDTGSAWSLVIDFSAGFLVFVSVTGLGIQVFMRKRRVKALAWMAGGAVLSVGLIWFAMV